MFGEYTIAFTVAIQATHDGGHSSLQTFRQETLEIATSGVLALSCA